MNTIYFDNAATSWPKPDGMIRAMNDFNANVGANPGRSGHRLSLEAARGVYDAREKVAKLINADPLEIVFAHNATMAINIALKGLLKPGDHVVTTGMEHNSIMRPLRELEKQGIALSISTASSEGYVSSDDIRPLINKSTKLIVMTHASNVTGTIMPVKDIAKLAHEHGLLFFTDAAQTAGSVIIDIKAMEIDLLAFTGHKSLYGPQGTGGLYIRKGLENRINSIIQGGTGSRSEFEEQPDFMPDKFESGTPNAIGLAGLSAGIDYILKNGIDAIREKEISLTRVFLDGLKSIKGVHIYGGFDASVRTATVSFNIDGISPSDLSFALDERFGILSRPGLHCAPAAHKSIWTFPQGTVRFSFGVFNTVEEIKSAIRAIESISHKKAP
jgi:cysteine desulfurase/selenocysteine lyase